MWVPERVKTVWRRETSLAPAGNPTKISHLSCLNLVNVPLSYPSSSNTSKSKSGHNSQSLLPYGSYCRFYKYCALMLSTHRLIQSVIRKQNPIFSQTVMLGLCVDGHRIESYPSKNLQISCYCKYFTVILFLFLSLLLKNVNLKSI